MTWSKKHNKIYLVDYSIDGYGENGATLEIWASGDKDAIRAGLAIAARANRKVDQIRQKKPNGDFKNDIYCKN